MRDEIAVFNSASVKASLRCPFISRKLGILWLTLVQILGGSSGELLACWKVLPKKSALLFCSEITLPSSDRRHGKEVLEDNPDKDLATRHTLFALVRTSNDEQKSSQNLRFATNMVRRHSDLIFFKNSYLVSIISSFNFQKGSSFSFNCSFAVYIPTECGCFAYIFDPGIVASTADIRQLVNFEFNLSTSKSGSISVSIPACTS